MFPEVLAHDVLRNHEYTGELLDLIHRCPGSDYFKSIFRHSIDSFRFLISENHNLSVHFLQEECGLLLEVFSSNMRSIPFLTTNTSDAVHVLLLARVFISKDSAISKWVLMCSNISAAGRVWEQKGIKRPSPESPANLPYAKKNNGNKICLPSMLHASSCLTSKGIKFNDCSKPIGTCTFSHDNIKGFKAVDVVTQFNGYYGKLSPPIREAVVKYIKANATA